MADHSDEKEERAADSQSNDLVERLTRRLNEPVGVIAVGYAQQKYARIMNWLVERFGLLDQLRARYGVEDARAAGSQLIMIEQPVGEQINYFSTTSQSFTSQSFLSTMAPQSLSPAAANQPVSTEARPSSFAEIINAHPTPPANESSSPPEGTYRVSRRAPKLSPASESQSTGATASPDKPDNREPADILKQPTRAQGTSESSSDVRTMPSLIYAKSGIEREEQIHSHAAEKPESREVPSGATVREVGVDRAKDTPTETDSPSMILAKSSVETSKPITAQEIPLSAAANEIKSEAIKDDIKGATQSSTKQQTGVEIVKSEPSERSPVSSLPLVKPLAGPMRIEDHQQSSARQSIETAPSTQASRRTDVVSEISDDSLSRARPDIVWRKSSDKQAADSTRHDLSGSATAARQTGSSASPTKEQQAGEVAMPAKTQASNEIQIEQLSPKVIRTISEQVIRTISFDLKIERERRGMSKWR